MSDAEALFARGEAALPAWDEPQGPKRTAKLARGLALLEQAFAKGHLGAGKTIVGLLQFTDIRASFDWAVKLARAADEDPLATLLREQDLPDALAQQALAWAEAGKPWAETALAIVHLNVAGGNEAHPALGIERKKAKAGTERWLRRAADRDWPSAQWHLAQRLMKAKPREALALAKSARKTKNATLRSDATKLYVALLEKSGGTAKDLVAVRQELAEAGDVESMTWLGDHHRDAGRDDAARGWYGRASEKGGGAAFRELAKMYETGRGVAVDDRRARDLYESAAEVEADPYALKKLRTKYKLAFYRGGKKG